MILNAVPVLIVLMLTAVILIIAAERFWSKGEFGALATALIAIVAYLAFPIETIIEVSAKIVGWASLIVFLFIVCFLFLSPRVYQKWRGRHGCQSS